YKGTEKMLHEILRFAWDNDFHSYDSQICDNLSEIYYKLGDYRNALKYYELYRKENAPLRGSLAIVEAAAFEVRSVVEQEQEEADYEKRNAEKELEDGQRHFRRMMIVSTAGFVASLVFVFFLWKMLQNTRKGNAALMSHNEEIKTQNEELNIEKAKIAEINSKIRQSMSYARRIQMATVSSEAEIEEVFANSMVYNKPCEVVSGDWYWASRIGSKKILALGGSAKPACRARWSR
ncbi:MAG: tetratricopeptide repeat-containing protein, partial [Bacteroidales bacterium]|nr:tetratricopeptide repeat-containing protein [Bacteroidales bacterium]